MTVNPGVTNDKSFVFGVEPWGTPASPTSTRKFQRGDAEARRRAWESGSYKLFFHTCAQPCTGRGPELDTYNEH